MVKSRKLRVRKVAEVTKAEVKEVLRTAKLVDLMLDFEKLEEKRRSVIERKELLKKVLEEVRRTGKPVHAIVYDSSLTHHNRFVKRLLSKDKEKLLKIARELSKEERELDKQESLFKKIIEEGIKRGKLEWLEKKRKKNAG